MLDAKVLLGLEIKMLSEGILQLSPKLQINRNLWGQILYKKYIVILVSCANIYCLTVYIVIKLAIELRKNDNQKMIN